MATSTKSDQALLPRILFDQTSERNESFSFLEPFRAVGENILPFVAFQQEEEKQNFL